ncbi:TetR/AcrR family transcriptional regulator [Saccharothrix stipae]
MSSHLRGEARREAVLDAALEILETEGLAGLTTRKVAERARASKETIYAHFGDRRGLLEALVLRQSAKTNALLDDDRPVREILVDAVRALLTLLTDRRSLALNRAAIAEVPGNPELAGQLLAHGRDTTGPLFEAVLNRAHHAGELNCPDPADAFTVLFGLAVRDAQIKALLTAVEWDPADIDARTRQAVEHFYRLYGT